MELLELYGVRMPELRSGARRSKRLDNLQLSTQENDQAGINPTQPQTRTKRRGGGAGGRGRGANAGPSTRHAGAGRGRGARLIDLDPEPPYGVTPAVPAFPIVESVLNRGEGMADKANPAMGASAEKIVGGEEDASATPVPERVSSCFLPY